jgi:hypothetical protein
MVTAPVAIALLGAVTSIAIAVACVATLRARAARAVLPASDRQHGESVELARKMEAASRLAGTVAHDVTDLLTAISGHAELLIASLDPSGTSIEDAHEIRRAALSAAQLTKPLEFRSMPRAIAVALVLALHVSVTAQRRTREVVRRDNISIEVIAEGRGRPILLLPSLGRDANDFDPVAERVAASGFRVLRPQPRGYGRSVGPMQTLTLHDFARDIAAVIEHEQSGPAIVAGHAFGHFVAKMTAVDFPQLVRGVVLIGAAQKTPNPEVQKAVAIATSFAAGGRAPQAAAVRVLRAGE